jgi:NADH dehydrogenase
VNTAPEPTVVVVGCGFAGYSLVRELRRRPGSALRIIVFDKQAGLYNYPALPRLLYETLAETDIEFPYRHLLAELDVDFRRECVTSIDPAGSVVRTDSSTVSFDYLVVATGSRAHPLPQDDGVFVFYPKAMRHLHRLRADLHDTKTGQVRQIAVVGGGLTGIEFALALRDAIDHGSVPGRKTKAEAAVHLFERHERLTPRQRPALSRVLLRELEAAGVEVHLQSEVSRATATGLLVAKRSVPMDSVVCCIGAKPHLRLAIDGLQTRGDGLLVDDSLRLAGETPLFVIGDVMTMGDTGPASLELRMAHRAVEQGRHVARNINNLLLGRKVQPYTPTEKPVSVLSHAGRGVLAYRDICFRGRLAGQVKRWLDLRHA